MNDERKLAFVAHQTKQALDHIRTTPNVMHPKGGLSHDKMMSFVTQVTKQGLQHFDAGGTTLSGPGQTGVSAGTGNTNTNNGESAGIAQSLGLESNFQGQAANVQAGTNAGQLNAAYTGTNNALTNQNNLSTETQPGTAQGLTAQGTLSGQLANEAVGGGPNPAQAALNQNTAQNINAQAALMASQRGASANPGEIARSAAEQGALTQQNAVGQAATLQAQQQLAAQTQEQNLAATQVGQGSNTAAQASTANQGEQAILQNANTANNNANVSSQNNINSVNGATATANSTGIGSLIGAGGSAISSIASLFSKGGLVKMDRGGNVLDANARAHIAPHNFALPGGRYPIHDLTHARNALARVSQNGSPEEIHKVRAAVHSKYPNVGVKKMVDGGAVELDSGKKGGIAKPPPLIDEKGPKSSVGKWLKSGAKMYDGGLAATGGNVKAGPGQQPVSTHDTIKNDKVPAMLTGGEVVMDLDTLHDKGPIGQMARVVAAHIAKRNKK